MKYLAEQFYIQIVSYLHRCQDVCLQHHESSKKKFQEELSSTYTEEKNRIKLEYQEQIETLR